MNHNRDIYAIVIGVGTYGDQPHDPRPLEDAQQLFKWLQSRKGGALPKQNLQLLLSPSREQMEKAFYYMGASDQTKIGQLLLVYFSGYGIGTERDSIGLLSADAQPDHLERSLDLAALRDLMQRSGSFQDYLWLIDYHCVSPTYISGPPSWTFSESPVEDANSLLIAHNRGQNCDPSERQRGVLTRMIQNGLAGSAADRNGEVSSQSLVKYIQRRFNRLRQETPDPIIEESGQDFSILQNPSRLPAGKLEVELPSWIHSLSITDNQFREVDESGTFEEDPDATEFRRFMVELLPGIYTVTASRGTVEEQHIISVLADEHILISSNDWKELQFEPVAPLTGGEDVPQNQTNRAADTSMAATWINAPAGSSRLFLFIRSTNPDRSKTFASGLKLFNADMEEVSDLSSGVKRNTRGGWLAFNADLPPGSYLLRRGRRGVPVRYQSIYLAENWETHIFLVTEKNYPALANLSLSMVPLGEGFDPANASMIIAETLIRGLSAGKRFADPELISRAKRLLDGAWTQPNMWLGIVTAYTLRTSLAFSEEDYDLYTNLLYDLAMKIGQHPDVRALQLQEDYEAESPFWYPPLLAAGLQMVQNHASSHASTIPVGSLTDLVLDRLIPGSPWTAWQDIDEVPRKVGEPEPTWEQTARMVKPKVQQRVLHGGKVIDLSGIADRAGPQQEELAVLRDSYILNQTQLVRQTAPDQAFPTTVNLNVRQRLNEALERLSPLEVSRKARLNLSKVEAGFQVLSEIDPTEFESDDQERMVFEQLGEIERKVIGIAAQSAMEETSSISQRETASLSTEIEGLAASLKTEADRTRVSGKEKQTASEAAEVARILLDAAKGLAEQSESLVLTDTKGKITSCNRAFLDQIAAGIPEESSAQNVLMHPATADVLRSWEEYLRDAPLGKSTLSDDALMPGSALLLERSEVRDEERNQVIAYINLIQRASIPTSPEQIREIEGLLPNLVYSNSLYAYGTEENSEKHLFNVKSLANQINQILSGSINLQDSILN